MQTIRASKGPPAVVLVTLIALVIAGCATAGPSDVPGSVAPPASGPPAETPRGAGPTPPIGTDGPPIDGGPGANDPGGEVVVPKPGQLDVGPIPADSITATVEGRRVLLTIGFTSGVEPCAVLDSIIVQRGEGSFAVTLRQGRGPGDNVCILIAVFKRTVVDLGELAPGTYTVTDATGGAPPITVVVD
jgi:hypothetical protein